jgi:glycine amidinotransferase/scyllo-inosamine-4-phosphate amidinotransferase 1
MISTWNEWDSLKRVVVGDATDANWPVNDPVFNRESEKTTWKETPVPRGPVPQRIIEETNEDLAALATTLTSLDVEVVRPDPLNFQTHDGMYNYCPRDRLLVYGDTIVNPAMMYPCRDMELQCYHDVVDAAANYLFMPRHEGMTLDAANIARLNDKWIYLESSSGNRAAYDWMCKHFPTVDIELVNFYSGVHIDSTIVPLREGLVLVNGSRVNPENLPRTLRDWEVIYCNHVEEQGFFQYPYASKWIALNMLVVNPHTVIVDKDQPMLIEILELNDFTVIPMQLRHSRTLGGGFHCVTLDLHREA